MRHGHVPHDDEILGKAYDAQLMGRLWRYVTPHRRLIAVSLLFLVAVSTVQLAQPYLIKQAIDGPIASGDAEGLLRIVLLFAGLLVMEFTLRFGQTYFLEKTGQRIVHDLRQELYRHLHSLSSSFFDRTPVGRLVTRVTTDVESLAEVFSSGVVTLIGDGLKVIGIVAILFWMDVRLALLTLSILPLLGVLAFLFRIRIRDAFRAVRGRIARINAYLHEALSGMVIVQLFRREGENVEEFHQINMAHRDADLRSVKWDSLFSAVIELTGSLVVAMIIWYGGGRVLLGAISFGTLVAFLEYAQKFFGPIRELGSYYSVMQSAMASSERIFGLLDTRTEVASTSRPATLPDPATGPVGHVEFDRVGFSYSDGPPVLRGMSCDIEPGEKIAIVGSTGAGKTTLVRLLIRLYDVDEGAIRIDGVDVKDHDLSMLRRRVGVVLQDHFLFSGTVASNIGMDDPSISRERIVEASRAVHAHDFISKLPDGYDHHLMERGSNLSIGQRQLLSFARALAFDPPLLVLDEATASVDSQTEMKIQDGLRAVMKGRTSIVIAHRLSTIRDSDRILVLHKGQVREEGTHEELLAARGIYSTLHRLQFRSPEGTTAR